MGADYWLFAVIDTVKIEAMHRIAEACNDAGISYPEEVEEYFENGGEGDCRKLIWSEGSCVHDSVKLTSDNPYYPVRIDLSKLPDGTKYIELDCTA